MKNLIIALIFLSVPLFSKTFLWEVSDEDSKIYLLGSVHVANKEMYPLNEVIESAYSNSEALVLEVVVDQINPLQMMSRMMLPMGKKLNQAMDSINFLEFKKVMDSLKVPEMSYMMLKPWAATLIMMQMIMQKEGFEQDLGFDYYFLGKARAEEKEVFGLETLDQQLDAFEEMSEFSSDFFKYSLSEIKNTKEMINEMLKAWEQGDTNGISQIITASIGESENFEKINEIMLDNRNLIMLEKIEDYLKNNNQYFVIAGAGHLIGEKGLLQLLEKTGKYKLKQL
jgi:uncharacterized protein YbaP (TraB family)